MAFSITYLDGTQEQVNGDQLEVGDDFITINQTGTIVAYRPRLNIKAVDRVVA